MLGQVIGLSEQEAANEVRTQVQEGEKILFLYKHKDFEGLRSWREQYGLHDVTTIFFVGSDEEWTEMKNMMRVRQHQGPIVIWYRGELTRDSLGGVLQRELYNLTKRGKVPMWVIKDA